MEMLSLFPGNSHGIVCNLRIATMTSGDDFQHKYAVVCNKKNPTFFKRVR